MQASRETAVVLLPAFDEAERLPAVLAAIAELGLDARTVVVDDASRDGTAELARAAGATVLSHGANLGYGAALQTGYKYALGLGAPWLVQLDADGQHRPADVPRLVEPVRDGEADVVIGSRFLEPTGYEMGAARSIGRRLIGVAARLGGLRVTDPTSGFQALGRRALELYADDFFPADYPDVDVLLVAHRRGLRVVERSVVMEPSARPSTLHGGPRDLWYAYKMLLSVLAATRGARRRGTPEGV